MTHHRPPPPSTREHPSPAPAGFTIAGAGGNVSARHAKRRTEAEHRHPDLLLRLGHQLDAAFLTNTIESLNARFPRLVKARGHFRPGIREAASGSSAGSCRMAAANRRRW